MKQIILMLTAVLFAANITTAAPKDEKKIVTTVFITDIDCQGCANKIYNNFYGKGVKSVKVDVATKSVEVTYDAAKNTPEGLIPSFTNLNVKVSKSMSAEEWATCKKHATHCTDSHSHSHAEHSHKH